MSKQTALDLSIPASTIHNGSGTFWTQYAPSKEFYLGLTTAVSEYYNYLLDQLSEVKIATGIRNAPSSFVYRKYPYFVTEGIFTSGKWVFDIPSNILSAEKIASSFDLQNASINVDKTDFEIRNGKLYTSVNLFELSPHKIRWNDTPTAIWWLINTEIEKDYIYCNFGYLLGLGYGVGKEFEHITRALWNILLGRRITNSILVLEAVHHGLPFSEYDQETVQNIHATTDGYEIVTDKETYRLTLPMRPGVSVGQRLIWGTPLIENFFVTSFYNGQIDPRIEKVYLPLDLCTVFRTQLFHLLENNSLLLLEDSSYVLSESGFARYGEVYYWRGKSIILDNNEVEVSLYPGSDGIEVYFPLVGNIDDIERFWLSVRNAELTLGRTLFDLWVERLGFIPTTVRPLQFFAKYVIRSACVVVFPSYITIEDIPTNLDYRNFLPGTVFLRASAYESEVTPPSDIFGWQKLVNTLPEPIFTSSVPCVAVIIQADSHNTGIVYVGGADAQNIPLAPGDELEMAVDNANKIYVRGNLFDRVYGHVLR